MKFFASTACVGGPMPIEDRLTEFARAGVRNVELGANITLPPGPFSAQRLPGELSYLIHNYFPPPADPFVFNLASADASIRRRSLELAANGLRLSAAIGAPFYSIHGGFITDAPPTGPNAFRFPMPESTEAGAKAMDHFVASVQELLRVAEEVNVQLLIENNVCTLENRGKLLLQSAEEFTALFDRCPSRHLGMLVDTGHLRVSAATFGFDREDFITSVAAHVRAFHVHDNQGAHDSHEPVREGSWVLAVLRRPEFAESCVVVEAKFADAPAVAEHLRWLEAQTVRPGVTHAEASR